MAKQSDEILEGINKILFYMRGGYTRDQLLASSAKEREHALKLIGENIERTFKTGMPLL